MEWGFNDNGLKTYCVNIDSITHVIKTKTLEKIIEQQFTNLNDHNNSFNGVLAARIVEQNTM